MFLLLALSPTLGAAQEATVVDEIVALVEEDIILKSEVDGLLTSVLRQQQIPYSEDLWLQTLNQIIDEKVIAVHASRDTTIIVTDEQIEQSLDDRIAQMSAQVGGEQRLEELYGKTVVEIKADLREDFSEQIKGEQFKARKLRGIRVTPNEVQEWFSQIPTDSLPTLPEIVRVAHIVKYPKISEAGRAEAMEVITAIRERIMSGESTLEDMARAFSEDPGSAETGGHYPSMKLSALVPEFAAMASRIAIGTLSQPFATIYGLHLLRVNKRLGENVDYNHILIPFDERKADPTEAIDALTVLRDSVLTHGASFETLARRHSEEESSKIQGGRVTDPRTGERDLFLEALGPRWQETLASLQEGDISEPREVELLDGRRAYHIVKLQKRIPPHRINLETDYALIEQYALREKQTEALNRWVKLLRKEVFIEERGQAKRLSMASN